MPSTSLVFALRIFLFFALIHAVSTDTPVPPLQWLNLTGLLQGSSQPPPLKNALIGYDESSRSVIIFGGEAASGLAQSQTYLLNLETLTWSVPSPPPNLQHTPPARSSAMGGGDFAASNRHGFVVFGGRGSNGTGLADVWEYDFNHQFWSQIKLSSGGPSPRWGASGGIDISTPPIQDAIVPGPNNTFYLVGGYDGIHVDSLSDVWRLNISGTLSPNLPDNASGSWDDISVGNSIPMFNQSGVVISNTIILAGGCNSTTSLDCPQQASYIINLQMQSQVSTTVCPAPRAGPVLVANLNKFTSTYSSQVFLLLGTVNQTKWDDGGALAKGEVAVLDIETGSWSRLLPSGDPGFSNDPHFPTPREGSAAVSYPQALVGQSRAASSDTLIFGGQDTSGNFLSEVWLLRAYNSSVTPSNPTWPGFGDGQLQTGVDANGAGVRVTYLTSCASRLSPTPQSQPPNSTTGPPKNGPLHLFDTSVMHKVLSPVSLVLLQMWFLVFRLTSPLYGASELLAHRTRYDYVASILAIASYTLGLAGLTTSFTSISAHKSVANLHLQTIHGISALVFFALLYVAAPLGPIVSSFRKCPCGARSERGGSLDAAEKMSSNPFEGPSTSTPHSISNISPTGSPQRRINSWGPSGIIQNSQEGSESDHSTQSAVGVTSGPQRRFEVLNRPYRTRKSSGLSYPPFEASPGELATRSLQHIDWLQRRRSLNAVGELDYAITQARREILLSTPATADGLVASNAQNGARSSLQLPSPFTLASHSIVHTLLLGLTVITLVMLWSRAPMTAFAGFLAWTVVFYSIMIILSCRLRTGGSLIGVLYSRLSPRPHDVSVTPPQPPAQEPAPGPYVHHQSPYRAVSSPTDGSYSRHGGPRSVETSDDDDELDEDTRQRMIEDEMGRRDVSIVTVPRRKLWITNPS